MFNFISTIFILINLVSVKSFTYLTVGQSGSGADYECDGTNDDVQIQKAICQIKGQTYDETLTYSDGYDSCGFKHPGLEADPYAHLGEGQIDIWEGTYNLNRQIWVYSNIAINGSGMDTTVLKLQDNAISFYQKYSEDGGWILEGGQSGFLRVYFADNVTITHMTLDGNKEGQTEDTIDDEYSYGRFALYTEASKWIELSYCRIKNWQGYGLDPHGVGGDDVYGEYLTITYNEVHDNDWDGITIDKSRYVTCAHNNVYDNGRHGINIVTGTEEAEVYDNILSNNGHYYDKERDGTIEGKGCGIMAQNNQLYGTSDVNIYDNTISGSNYAGICLHSVYSFEVYRNSLTGTQNWCIRLALQSENTLGSYNNKIYENTCDYTRGIYLTKDSYTNKVFENSLTVSDDTYGISNRDEEYSSATNEICDNIYFGSVTTDQEVYYSDGKYTEKFCNGETQTPTSSPTSSPTVPGQTYSPTESPTQAPTQAADPNCDNGIIKGDICCLDSCGTCGGSGCSSRDGGSEGCCTSTIAENGDSCDDGPAPCVIQPSGGEPDPNCDTGISKGNICCAASCGSCGGSGCSSRTGGASSCCTSTIKSDGNSCDFNPPPCVM